MKQYSKKATSLPTAGNQYRDVELVILTDVHLCHINWYGMTSEERMDKMINDVNAFYEKQPYDATLFLGDYSLDYWETGNFGSWRHRGVSNTYNFLTHYADRMTCPDYYILPGNHEQYGNDLWRAITGFDRQYYIKLGGYLIFMLDNFAGDLDPVTDNHGIYSPTAVEAIRGIMELNPGMPVFLCAHFFDLTKETEKFRELVRDERVLALFCGHDHVRTIEDMGEAYGNKKIFHCGTFSYTDARHKYEEHPWGWRTLSLRENGIKVTYYTPESVAVVGGNPIKTEAGFVEEVTVPNPLAAK